MRIVWQTVRTITKEILGVKGLSKHRHYDKFVRKDKHSGLGCSELVWDNPGSVWNLITDLKALKNSVKFSLSTVLFLDALKRKEKNLLLSSSRALE